MTWDRIKNRIAFRGLLPITDDGELVAAVREAITPEAQAARVAVVQATEQAVAEDAPAEPPLVVVRDAHYKTKRDKWKRSIEPAIKVEGELLGKVLRGDVFTDDKELLLAGIAVARAARDLPGMGTSEIKNILLGAAGRFVSDIDELVELSIAQAKEPVERKKRTPPTEGKFIEDPKTGNPTAEQHNIDVALAKLKIDLSYDLLARATLVKREDATPKLMQDEELDDMFLEIESAFHFKCQDGYFAKVIKNRARKNSYHPVLEYLAAAEAQWDSTHRLDTWLIRLTGAKDTPYVRAVSRIILVAAARRARQPGAKFDEMLVLESVTQGTDKTTFVRALCADELWFGNQLPLHATTQKQMECTKGKWIIEAGELSGMKKADHRELKDYLSRQEDESRQAYGHLPERRPRHFIVIGTTNDKKYLKDEHNRRYWPVEIVRCDVKGLLAELDQLWAEAAIAETAGESIRLAEHLWAEAGAEQEERRQIDLIEAALVPALEHACGIISTDDAYRLAGFDDRPNTLEWSKIMDVMTLRLGWKHTRLRRSRGERPYCFASPKATDGQWLQVVGQPGSWRLEQVLAGPRPGKSQSPVAN